MTKHATLAISTLFLVLIYSPVLSMEEGASAEPKETAEDKETKRQERIEAKKYFKSLCKTNWTLYCHACSARLGFNDPAKSREQSIKVELVLHSQVGSSAKEYFDFIRNDKKKKFRKRLFKKMNKLREGFGTFAKNDTVDFPERFESLWEIYSSLPYHYDAYTIPYDELKKMPEETLKKMGADGWISKRQFKNGNLRRLKFILTLGDYVLSLKEISGDAESDDWMQLL